MTKTLSPVRVRSRFGQRRRLRRQGWSESLRRAAASGLVAASATEVWVALAGAWENDAAAAPVNATSHIVWGNPAAAVDEADAKHTLVGTVLHFGACVLWASVYEQLFGRATERGDAGTALAGAAAVATAAYVTDYHVVPQRLTPGWELRLSQRAIGVTYVLLALALPLRGLLGRKKRGAHCAPDSLP